METNLDERLQRIESALVHLEHQYDQLNEIVVSQGKQLTRFRATVERVDQALHGMEIEKISSNNQKPPHYQ